MWIPSMLVLETRVSEQCFHALVLAVFFTQPERPQAQNIGTPDLPAVLRTRMERRACRHQTHHTHCSRRDSAIVAQHDRATTQPTGTYTEQGAGGLDGVWLLCRPMHEEHHKDGTTTRAPLRGKPRAETNCRSSTCGRNGSEKTAQMPSRSRRKSRNQRWRWPQPYPLRQATFAPAADKRPCPPASRPA